MTMYFYKTGELNRSNYVEAPLRSSAILNVENDEKYCFLRSILAHFHPCNENHPNRVSIYRQCFKKLNIGGFDLTIGFKCSDVHKFGKLNNLSSNMSELNFYRDQKIYKHKLTPIGVFLKMIKIELSTCYFIKIIMFL